MTPEQQQEIIGYLEFVLEPIKGKFLSFEEPTIMYGGIRELGDYSNILSEKNKIIIYHLKFNTKHGDIVLSISSDNLGKDLKGAVMLSIGYSFPIHQVPNEDYRKIDSKIYEMLRNK